MIHFKYLQSWFAVLVNNCSLSKYTKQTLHSDHEYFFKIKKFAFYWLCYLLMSLEFSRWSYYLLFFQFFTLRTICWHLRSARQFRRCDREFTSHTDTYKITEPIMEYHFSHQYCYNVNAYFKFLIAWKHWETYYL